MKKTLALLLGLATISSSVAYADISPGPANKDIPSCAMIDNLASFPKVTFITAKTGETSDSDSNSNSFSFTVLQALDDQSCVSRDKWSHLELFAIDKNDINWFIAPARPDDPLYDPLPPQDPKKDIKAYQVAKGSAEFSHGETERVSTAEANITQYKHYIYHIIGIDNSMKTFSLALTAEKTAVDTKKYDWDADPTAVFEKEVKIDTPVFNDVKNDNDYTKPVLFLKRNGYVKGYDDGSYKPENTINRAEFTKIVMHDFKSTKTYDCSKQIFKDVSTDAKNWYRDYVCKAFNEGIIMGYSDNTFRPDQPITFAEAAKIILKVEGRETNGKTDPWYKEFTDYFQNKNILPKTIKAHNKEITRGDMALLIRSIIDPLFYSGKTASIIDPLFYKDTKGIIDPLF